MRAEFYVSQVVRWNMSLRTKVASIIGIGNFGYDTPEAILRELRGPHALADLASRLWVETSEVFLSIKERLVDAPVDGKAESRRTRKESEGIEIVIRSPSFINRCAEILGCTASTEDVYSRVFEIDRMRSILESVPGLSIAYKNASQVMDLVLCRDGRFAVLRALAVTDMRSALLALVKEEAAYTLSTALRCTPELILSRLGAGTSTEVRKSTKPKQMRFHGGDTSQHLDLFAVEQLREILLAVSSNVLDQATEAAKALGANGAVDGATRLAPALIAFLGNGSFRKALKELPKPVMRLRDLAESVRAIDSTVRYGPGQRLRALNEGPESLVVVVEYTSSGATEWQGLLQLIAVDKLSRDRVLKGLPHTSNDLEGNGITLLERVVTSTIGWVGLSEWEILRAWTSMDNAPSDFFVASGERLVDNLGLTAAFSSDKSWEAISLGSSRMKWVEKEDLLHFACHHVRVDHDPDVV